MGRSRLLWHGRTIAVGGGGGGTVTYDTTMGSAVDANGFTTLPLRSGAARYFVKNSGSDANAGTNPTLPLASVSAAWQKVTAGAGDQVLMAEGSTWNETLPQSGDTGGWLADKPGFSALYPTVFSSYDPADPTNEAKYGMGHQRNARPKLTRASVINGNGTYSFYAIKGLELNPGNIPNSSIGLVGKGSYLLFENNIFAYTGLSVDAGDPVSGASRGSNIIVRNNAFFGMWAQSVANDGRTGGLYASGYDGVINEDNTYYHCGWKIGANRGDDPNSGGATVFSHSYYLQDVSTGIVTRRNLSMDGGGDGGAIRGDMLSVTENLYIDNPLSLGLGGGPNFHTDRPASGFPAQVVINASYNAILGDADVTPAHALGWAIHTSNGHPSSRVHHNLILRSRNPSSSEMNGFTFDQGNGVVAFSQYDHNLMYQWISPTIAPHSFNPDPLSGANLGMADYNKWDGAALGTNTNSGGLSFPSALTADQLYSAFGFANKQAFVDYVIAHPEAHIQRDMRAMLFAGYGLTAPVDTTAPVLSSPTQSVAGTTATVGATTNEANGKLYYVVSTSATPPSADLIKHGVLDYTDTTFTAAIASGSIAVSSAGAKTVNATLSTGTYYAHFMHADAESNQSNVVSTIAFTI